MQRKWHNEALCLREAGMSWRAIAEKIGIPRSTVSDFLRKPVDKKVENSYEGKAKILFIG